MKFSQRKNHQASIVYLYDPIPLDRVSLDTLKSVFSRVFAIPDQEIVVAESPERKIKAQIQIARLEYTDESGRDFSLEQVEPIQVLLRAMPPISVKAYGVNLHLRVVMEGFENAAAYTTQNFLAGAKNLEEKLEARIVGSAERFLYGEETNYFDVRITPIELGGEWLHFQLHKHKDTHLTDNDRIYEETKDAQKETIAELARLEQIL